MTQSIISDDFVKQSQERLIAVFDVNTPEIPEEILPPEKQASNQNNSPIKNQPVETSSIILPQEWSISSIAQKNASDTAGSDGNGDKNVYDPYAGASPQFEAQSQSSYIADYSTMDPEFDPKMFEEWIAKLRSRLRRSSGTIMLSVTLDDGRVTSAEIMDGNASMPLQLFVRNDAMGQKLFRSGSGKKSLPEIRL